MRKSSLVCGLLLCIGSTGFAQTVTASAAPAVPATPVSATEVSAGGIDAQSLQELRARVEAKLKSTQELKARINAQLASLDKRVKTAEKNSWQPKVDVHGYSRLRHERYNFEGFKNLDLNTMRINLFPRYQVNDRWSIKGETEFEHNLTFNAGPHEGTASYDYDKGGKRLSREVLQLYAEGRIGEVEVRAGRYFVESPHKLTFDEKIDGVQLKWGVPAKWGRAEFTLNAGFTWSTVMYRDPDNKINMNDDGYGDFKVISLMSSVPVMKNTRLVSHIGRIAHRDHNDMSRNTYAFGFDTKLAPEVKFRASTAKSNASTLNRSHFMELKYKEAIPAVPGSYGLFARKFLKRGHTGLTKWSYDEMAMPQDFADRIAKENGLTSDEVRNNFSAGEFNGFSLGAELVPTRETKLTLEYIFGNLGLMKPGTGMLDGRRKKSSSLTAMWELYF